MNCPYCNNPGISRETDLSVGNTSESWLCVKCPHPVSYHSDKKKTAIWVLYNGSWYSIIYLPTLKKYLVQHETFDLRINDHEAKEEWSYDGSLIIQLPCDEDNVTPTNAKEKL